MANRPISSREALWHKLLGSLILVLCVRYAGYSMQDIGFVKKGAAKGTLLGLALGLSVFAIAYFAEYNILQSTGKTPSLAFYVSAYTLSGNIAGQTTVATVSLCILFNLINVVMKEGLFRGLFFKPAETKSSLLPANTVLALLFGLWHITLPSAVLPMGSSRQTLGAKYPAVRIDD